MYSKRKGLDKALYQIEQALRRARTGEQSDAEQKSLRNLYKLLGSNYSRGMDDPQSHVGPKRRHTDDPSFFLPQQAESDDGVLTPENRAYLPQHREGSLTIDDAENPLQLVARASKLRLSPGALSADVPSPDSLDRCLDPETETEVDDDTEIRSYFTSIRVSLDIGDDVDPLSIGLVTEAEAQELFDLYEPPLSSSSIVLLKPRWPV